MVLRSHILFYFTQNMRSNPREQDRIGVHLLDTETGCRVCSVGAGKPSVENSTKSFLVSRDAGKE